MFIEDFTNWSPQKCKSKIHEYQRTRDKNLFGLLLARYDRYLIGLAAELRRKYTYLHNEPLEDLYIIAIVGFGKALVKFKEKASSNLIFPVIKAYVKVECHKECKSKKHEVSENSVEQTGSASSFAQFKSINNGLSARIIATSPLLTEREQKLLNLRFFRGLTLREMAELEQTPFWKLAYELKKVVRKIKNRVKYFQLGDLTNGTAPIIPRDA